MSFVTEYDFREILSDQQKKMHIPTPGSLENIETVRVCESRKREKTEEFREFTEISKECSNNIKDPFAKYIIPQHIKASYLVRSTLEIVIPVIKVKDEFKEYISVRWKKNLVCLLIVKATMKDLHNPGVIFNIDGYSQYIYVNNLIKNGSAFRKSWERNVGNIPELMKWNTTLNGRILTLPQIWPYSNTTFEGYPLFIYPNHNTSFNIEHLYEYNLHTINFLCVRKLNEDGSYQRIVNVDRIIEYIDFPENIAFPRLELTFSKSNVVLEKTILNCIVKSDKYKVYVREFYKFNNVMTTYSRKIKQKIFCDTMILALFWSIRKRDEFVKDPYKTYRKLLPFINKSSFGNLKYEELRHWSHFSFEKYNYSLSENDDLGLMYKSFSNMIAEYNPFYYTDGKIIKDIHNIFLTNWTFPYKILPDTDINPPRYEETITDEVKDLFLSTYALTSKLLSARYNEDTGYQLYLENVG